MKKVLERETFLGISIMIQSVLNKSYQIAEIIILSLKLCTILAAAGISEDVVCFGDASPWKREQIYMLYCRL